jgi:L-threonylcarbamoyladenylate synthase
MLEFKLDRIIELLNNGELVVYPTDTLYALGADISNELAVRKVFQVKKRPFNHPLPVAVSCLDEINSIAFINSKAWIICEKYLPGSLTVILPKKNKISAIVTGGLDKIAVRVPDNEIALELLKKYGPLTVTSANIHNGDKLTNIKDIKEKIGERNISGFIDYGVLDNPPSTIVDITRKEPLIIREGKITKEEIIGMISNG